MDQFKPNNIKPAVGDKSAGITRVTPAAPDQRPRARYVSWAV